MRHTFPAQVGTSASPASHLPRYITIHEPVSADFSAMPTSDLAPLSVTFTNQSNGDYDTCTWDFGDADTSSDCNNPAHAYTSTGTYTVTLTVSGPGGLDSSTLPNYIQALSVYRVYLPIAVRQWVLPPAARVQGKEIPSRN